MRAGSRDSTFSPDELSAVKTEGGLPEESWHELVPVNLVDPPSHGPIPLPRKLLVGLLFYCGFIWQEKKTKTEQKFKQQWDKCCSQKQIHWLWDRKTQELNLLNKALESVKHVQEDNQHVSDVGISNSNIFPHLNRHKSIYCSGTCPMLHRFSAHH